MVIGEMKVVARNSSKRALMKRAGSESINGLWNAFGAVARETASPTHEEEERSQLGACQLETLDLGDESCLLRVWPPERVLMGMMVCKWLRGALGRAPLVLLRLRARALVAGAPRPKGEGMMSWLWGGAARQDVGGMQVVRLLEGDLQLELDAASSIAAGHRMLRVLMEGLGDACPGDTAAAELAQILKRCARLQVLDLAEDKIGDAGAEALAVVLPGVTTLAEIDLSFNRFGLRLGGIRLGEVGAKHLEAALPLVGLCAGREVPGLVALDIPCTGIGAHVGRLARAALSSNVLQSLDLRGCCISHAGVVMLVQAGSGRAHPHAKRSDSENEQEPAHRPAAGQISGPGFRALTSLNLRSNLLRDDGARVLGEEFLRLTPALRTLDLGENELGIEGVARVALALPNLSRFQELSLFGNKIGVERNFYSGWSGWAGRLAVSLAQCPCLTSVDLTDNVLLPDGASVLAASLPSCARLKRLVLNHTRIGSLGVERLSSALAHLPRLQDLHISYARIGDQGLAMLSSAVHACPLLASLHLAGNNISSEGAWSLAAVMPDLKALTELDISNNVQLGQEGVSWLASAFLEAPSLAHIDLGGTDVGLIGAMRLSAALPRLTALTSLSLPLNELDDTALEQLAQALPLAPRLAHLDLSDNAISDEGCFALAAILPACPRLARLRLTRNRFTPDGARRLWASAPPSLQLFYTP
ncbi:hypothetical protein T484DRAFT_1908833 [Baffinella frigidus]|nr:hypothetical protein T484DRAFT_1908833 [Cryptophyta sp. CCMP2293]